MELDGTRLSVLKMPENTFVKLSNASLPEIVTVLLDRPSCEQFYVGAVFSLPNQPRKIYHHTEGGVIYLWLSSVIACDGTGCS